MNISDIYNQLELIAITGDTSTKSVFRKLEKLRVEIWKHINRVDRGGPIDWPELRKLLV